MVTKASNLTAMLQQLAVITFKVDDIIESTQQKADCNRRGKLYSGYETMRRMMLDLLVDVSEESAIADIKAGG